MLFITILKKNRGMAALDIKKGEKYMPTDWTRPIENCGLFNKMANSEGDASSPYTKIDDSMLEWERKCPLLMGNLEGAGSR